MDIAEIRAHRNALANVTSRKLRLSPAELSRVVAPRWSVRCSFIPRAVRAANIFHLVSGGNPFFDDEPRRSMHEPAVTSVDNMSSIRKWISSSRHARLV